MTSGKKIGILEAGHTPDELLPKYGRYSHMFLEGLLKVDPTFSFEIYNVTDHDFPDHEKSCDGWLITGSKHGVYDQLSWMGPLKDFIRRVFDCKVPMVGICFGHQIIADAFGGVVEKSSKGWGLGPQSYEVLEPFVFDFIGHQILIHAIHQDQVIDKPDVARPVVRSEFCEFAGLAYEDSILTFQPHPEFSDAYMRELIEVRSGTLLPECLSQKSIGCLDEQAGKMDSERVMQHLVQFFHKDRDMAFAS